MNLNEIFSNKKQGFHSLFRRYISWKIVLVKQKNLLWDQPWNFNKGLYKQSLNKTSFAHVRKSMIQHKEPQHLETLEHIHKKRATLLEIPILITCRKSSCLPCKKWGERIKKDKNEVRSLVLSRFILMNFKLQLISSQLQEKQSLKLNKRATAVTS